MIKKIHILKEIVTEDEVYEVEYTLREYSDQNSQRRYGFCLEEYLRAKQGDDRMLIESAETPAVFENYMDAELFYRQLINESVFPQTLYDHIDDWNCAFHPHYRRDLL